MATSAPLGPDERHEARSHERADPERRAQEALERSERATEHRVGDDALHDRQRVDVDDRVPDADHAERGDGDEGDRHASHENEREAEQRKPEREVARETAACREDEGDEPADQPTDSDGGVEEADAGLVEVEQLERRDDDEHVERSGDERLRPVQADERAQVRLPDDRPDAGHDAARLVPAAPASRDGRCARSVVAPQRRGRGRRTRGT